MKQNMFTVKEAMRLIKINKFGNNDSINFNNEKIDFEDAVFLGRNGINVPEELIFYDDDNIDCSDISEMTQDDINSGKLKPVVNAHIPINNEINEWMKKENINVGELSAKLIESFYENIKLLSKNIAL